jgi:hypothetical protein
MIDLIIAYTLLKSISMVMATPATLYITKIVGRSSSAFGQINKGTLYEMDFVDFPIGL